MQVAFSPSLSHLGFHSLHFLVFSSTSVWVCLLRKSGNGEQGSKTADQIVSLSTSALLVGRGSAVLLFSECTVTRSPGKGVERTRSPSSPGGISHPPLVEVK